MLKRKKGDTVCVTIEIEDIVSIAYLQQEWRNRYGLAVDRTMYRWRLFVPWEVFWRWLCTWPSCIEAMANACILASFVECRRRWTERYTLPLAGKLNVNYLYSRPCDIDGLDRRFRER